MSDRPEISRELVNGAIDDHSLSWLENMMMDNRSHMLSCCLSPAFSSAVPYEFPRGGVYQFQRDALVKETPLNNAMYDGFALSPELQSLDENEQLDDSYFFDRIDELRAAFPALMENPPTWSDANGVLSMSYSWENYVPGMDTKPVTLSHRPYFASIVKKLTTGVEEDKYYIAVHAGCPPLQRDLYERMTQSNRTYGDIWDKDTMCSFVMNVCSNTRRILLHRIAAALGVAPVNESAQMELNGANCICPLNETVINRLTVTSEAALFYNNCSMTTKASNGLLYLRSPNVGFYLYHGPTDDMGARPFGMAWCNPYMNMFPAGRPWKINPYHLSVSDVEESKRWKRFKGVRCTWNNSVGNALVMDSIYGPELNPDMESMLLSTTRTEKVEVRKTELRTVICHMADTHE